MASVVYNRGKQRLVAGSVDLNNLKVLVLTAATTTPDNPDHDFVDDIVANEASGTGYARSAVVTGVTVTIDNTNDEVYLTHDDVTFVNYGPDSPALFVVYYEDAVDDATRSLVWVNDLQSLAAGLRTPDGSDFIIRSPSGGVIKATN